MVNAADTLNWHQPKTRIVQYDKRRFALRLEETYWRQLEAMAERRQIRLGRLVASLAKDYDGVNLSSYIRGFCMHEAQRDLARYRLTAGAFDLIGLLRGCPAPALLLDHNRIILETNPALLQWVGAQAPALKQADFETYFVPRAARPLVETLDLMQQRLLQRAQLQLAYTVPDQPSRVINATLTGLPVGQFFYCLVWLHVGGRG
jgi:predicted DNA-binding ribbon-helix-helix protein